MCIVLHIKAHEILGNTATFYSNICYKNHNLANKFSSSTPQAALGFDIK